MLRNAAINTVDLNSTSKLAQTGRIHTPPYMPTGQCCTLSFPNITLKIYCQLK